MYWGSLIHKILERLDKIKLTRAKKKKKKRVFGKGERTFLESLLSPYFPSPQPGQVLGVKWRGQMKK